MRRPIWAALTAAGALAGLGGAARAADHQYYSVMAGEDQAVLIDLSTKSRTGDIAAFDMIVLQRQPSNATGQPTYWVDGVQEVDCAQHRTRIMMVSAYSLDRSRKISSPGAAFRPWTGNAPGSDTRAIEDFACRAAPNPAIRPVADLAAFQRDYFQRGAQAAKAAPAAPQAAADTPKLDLMLIEDGAEGAIIVNRATRDRQGDIADIAVIILEREPIAKAEVTANWVEADEQVNCRAHTTRTKVTMYHTLNLDHQEAVASPSFSDWQPIDDATAPLEALMCQGVVAKDFRPVADLRSFQQGFFANAGRAGSASPTVATAASYYLVGGSAADGEMIFNVKGALVSDGLVNVSFYTLRSAPVNVEGVSFPVYWGSGDIVIDCRQHRWRIAVSRVANLDRTQTSEIKSAKFSDWQAIPMGSRIDRGEALMCLNRLPPGVTPVNDLAAFARQRVSGSPTAQQAQAAPANPAVKAAPPRPAPAATPAKAEGRYYVIKGPRSRVFLPVADVRRQGSLVMITEMMLTNEPMKTERAGDIYWYDSETQFDCDRHRSRNLLRAMAGINRSGLQTVPDAAYDDWSANEPNSLSADIEALVCRNQPPADMERTDDLIAYQRTFLTGPGPQRPPAAQAQAQPVSPKAASSKSDYLLAAATEDGAQLIRKSSIKRNGDLVSYVELDAFPTLARQGDKVVAWAEHSNEVDCKAHRYRVRSDAFLSEDRGVRTPDGKNQFTAWKTSSPESFGRALEDFVCRGKGAKDFDPVEDVDQFRTEYLAALKGGVLKN